MERRRFISRISFLLSAAVAGTDIFLASCNPAVKEEQFDLPLLDEIGETIIPATPTSPGAKAAAIGAFMKSYVTDCYDAGDQQTFFEGIQKIKDMSKRKYGETFLNLAASQKQEVLRALANEGREPAAAKQKNTASTGDAIQTGRAIAGNNHEGETGSRHFSLIRDLTLLGYFTSKPGAKQALRYVQTPGYFRGEVPYKKGDKAWAT